ncbi:unnamed protein product [Brassicogethes aeneus]|uniref:Uncharacterized protein n=1 Tax=Brassicogethes aeneus TaxID=1431903 RepID=A0A9P0B9J4_BRAAE|nr:unnamed protein product [Brassicogethes aeneus]
MSALSGSLYPNSEPINLGILSTESPEPNEHMDTTDLQDLLKLKKRSIYKTIYYSSSSDEDDLMKTKLLHDFKNAACQNLSETRPLLMRIAFSQLENRTPEGWIMKCFKNGVDDRNSVANSMKSFPTKMHLLNRQITAKFDMAKNRQINHRDCLCFNKKNLLLHTSRQRCKKAELPTEEKYNQFYQFLCNSKINQAGLENRGGCKPLVGLTICYVPHHFLCCDWLFTNPFSISCGKLQMADSVVKVVCTKFYNPNFLCFSYAKTGPGSRAPLHWHLVEQRLLNEQPPHRWIGRKGTNNLALHVWSTHSTDLTVCAVACDFFLWGFIKENVYEPQDL